MGPLSNPRDERFAREYVRTGNGTEAYHTAVSTDINRDSARTSAYKKVHQDSIQDRIKELLEKTNPISRTLTHLNKLQRAQKKIFYEGKHVDNDHDFSTQLGAVKLAMQAHGILSDEKNSATQAQQIIINVNAIEEKNIEGIA